MSEPVNMSPDPHAIARATAALCAAWMPDTEDDVAAYSVPMCASTGLRHGGIAIGIDGQPFTPLDDRPIAAEISKWWDRHNGHMSITGSRARNLNPIIMQHDSERSLEFAWWWIWLDPSGPVKFSAFNARDDKLMRSWRRPFQQRALVPASWWVEKGVIFEHVSHETMGLAAIANTVQFDDGSALTSYALVTRDAVGEARTANDRMPLVLPPVRHDEWLDPGRPGDAGLAEQLTAWSEEVSLEMVPVGKVEKKTRPKPAAESTLF